MVSKEHLDDDVLERYAMDSLPEDEAEVVEDHTSLCTQCMDRLDETTTFVKVLRKSLQDNPVRESFPSRLTGWLSSVYPAWAAGAVAAAVLLIFVMRPVPLPALATVVVGGTRGASTVVHGSGPFDFELFMPETAAKYHVELLDQSGAKSWEGDVAGDDGNLHAIVNRRIAAGQYFLRVSEPISKAVHDFGLKIER